MTRSSSRRRSALKRIVWRRPRMPQPRSEEMSDRVFWCLVLLCIGLSLWPTSRLVAYPFTMLATISHEIAHLVAAWLVGGEALGFIVTPDLGGMATSKREGDMAGAIVAGAGLLGPPIVSGILIILTRGLKQSALALLLLGVGVVSAGFFWGNDLFTQACCYALGGLVIMLGFVGQPRLRSIIAQTVAIFLSVNGVLALDYAFSAGGTVAGTDHYSDTFMISTYLGGSYLFWGTLIAVTSLSILLLAVSLSTPVSRRRG